MSKAAISMYVYGVYVLGMGFGVLTMQQWIMPIMGMDPGADHWVYTVGVFAVALGYYYVSSARSENKEFFKISIYGRTWFFTATAVLVGLGTAPVMMMPLALVDLVGAGWTWKTLEK